METAIIFAALALYVGAGVVVARRITNSDDFYIMSARGSTVLIVGTLAATYLSAVTLLGISGISYTQGPLVITATASFGAWLGTLLAVIYVGRKMKALNCRTMPDFFQWRFQNRAVTAVASLIMIVGLLGYGVIQLIGAGLVLSEVTGIQYPLMIAVFVLAILVFAALGGMYGVVVTDTLMFFTMLAVSMIIAPWIMAKVGFAEMKDLSESYPGYWTIGGTEGMPLTFSLAQFLVWILFFTCTPALVSRVFPARNDFVILKAAIIGIFLVPFMQIPVFLAANAMRVLQPGIEEADRVMIVAFMEEIPAVLGGVGLAALMASIMSTASTLFVLAGFGLSRDLYENLRSAQISERHRLIVSRTAQVIIGLLVGAVAVSRPAAIYWISVWAGAIFAVGWLPTVVAGLEWRRMNANAAMISMLTGVVSYIGLSELTRREIVALPLNLDPLLVSFPLAVIALVVVALLTRPTEKEVEYFSQVKNVSASKLTIDDTLSRPDALEKLKQEYRNIYVIAISFIVLAVVVWGYFFINLGL